MGWRRVLAGDPVEVSANDGGGFKVMTINEYTAVWKVRGLSRGAAARAQGAAASVKPRTEAQCVAACQKAQRGLRC